MSTPVLDHGPGTFDPATRRPSITCGHCRRTHASTAEVRACSGRPDVSRKDPATEVPAGRYAVKINGELRFYKIDKPVGGRWDGYTFVKREHGDNLIKIGDRREREAIIAAIAINPAERSKRYGRETRRCGVCNTKLQNELSRELGIGPDCRAKLGW